MPNAGSIVGGGVLCPASTITLTDGSAGGAWSSSSASATVTSGIVTGVTVGTSTISYVVTNSCGTATATSTVTVSPLPNAGTISGSSNVCIGSIITLTDGTLGGSWSTGNANATVVGGVVTGVSAGGDTIGYLVTNSCGSATATSIITVNPLPSAGVITY